MEENLKIYKLISEVPKEAQKKITGGRLNGMTDIKPMWRIEKLTELFGMCGFGWKTNITNKEIIEGANGEKIAIVDIELFVKQDGVWSEAILGTGGSSFIAKEKSGLYTSDECFKMAYTDAISVACKSLGMGASVYWGDSKYQSNEPTKEDAEAFIVSFGKYNGKKLSEVIKDDYYKNYLLSGNDEYLKKCIELLTGEKAPNEEELKEQTTLLAEFNKLVIETNTDIKKILNNYEVESTSKLSIEQLKDAIKVLKKKVS